ncbi:MAG: dTMP kinase [Helicobacter sp.]|nr:dTMP kinase [Helicobacter sp.]
MPLKYVALEGIDTVGKSTQIQKLKDKLPSAFFTREPGASTSGEKISDLIFDKKLAITKEAEFFLFLADRFENFYKNILPNQNSLIVSDRSLISGMAYYHDINFSTKIHKEILNFHPDLMPKKVILLSIDEINLKKRLQHKSNDLIELRGISYLLKVQQNMLEILHHFNIDHLQIDATKKECDIAKEILDFIT